MATLTIEIAIPNDKVAELSAALDAVFPTSDGSPRSNAERQALLKKLVIERLRNVYRSYKREQAREEALNNPLGLT